MRYRTAHTLLELVVVLFVLTALSSLVAPLFAGTLQNASEVATQRTLVQVRDAVNGYWRDTKYIVLDGIVTVAPESDRFLVDWLFASPVSGDSTWEFAVDTKIGWRGPYLFGSTGDIVTNGGPIVIDAWNNAITLQDVDASASLREVRIVSGGPDGVVEIPTATPTSSLTAGQVGDDVYVTVYLR